MIFMTSNTQIWISKSVEVSFLIINRGEFRFLVRSTLRVVFLISKVTQQVEIEVTQIYRNSSFSLCQQKWQRNSFLREHKAPADFFKVLYFNYLCICFSLLQLSIIHVPIRLFTQLSIFLYKQVTTFHFRVCVIDDTGYAGPRHNVTVNYLVIRGNLKYFTSRS